MIYPFCVFTCASRYIYYIILFLTASGDIADGSVEQTLELLWSIIARYQVASDVDISNEKDLFSLKDGLIKFLEVNLA